MHASPVRIFFKAIFVVLYEFPLNERVRTYLRLEHLFTRLKQLIQGDEALDHHFALVTMFEIIDVASRSELKQDITRDFEKYKQQLTSFRGNPAIAQEVLDETLAELDAVCTAFNAQVGKTGSQLTDNDWITSIRSRIAIPAGTCEFDLPAYHLWKHQASDVRRANILDWTSSLWPLSHATSLMLKILRDSGTPKKVVAVSGVYQQTFPQGRSYQLLRVRIPLNTPRIPEISGNRLRFSIRLLTASIEGKSPVAPDTEFSFELGLCS